MYMAADDSIGLAEAWAEHLARQKAKHPNAVLKDMFDRGAPVADLLSEMNKLFAVVKYGDGIVVANIVGKQLSFMSEQEFHKMLANLTYLDADGKERKLSRLWFKWRYRRQYIGRGAVFEPGGPLEIPGDMINIFRGFGVEPAPGDWSLMRAHILNVLCSGRQDLSHYLIQWMAWSVQKLDQPIGVAVALLGEQGAGKGIFARTFGSFFGDHFAHIANGDQLTGRFNASVGKSCFVFLDEAVWAGDKKGEGVLKALITEPTLSLEAKFRDPITVKNCLRIMVASNNEWAVPAGVGDRRWLILNINNRYAGTKNATYFAALKLEIDNGGAAAMLHDLLAIDLSGFNVRDVPRTAAKAQQQALSLPSVEAWLYQVLQEGAIEQRVQPGGSVIRHEWQATGLNVSKDVGYAAYEDFSSRRKEYRPATKSTWSKRLIKLLGPNLMPIRHVAEGARIRSYRFAGLAACRDRFAHKMGADFEWEPYQPTQGNSSAPPAVFSEVKADAAARQGQPQATPMVTAAEAILIAKNIGAAEGFVAKRR
jgi:Family of unknown function (DUF5906)